jgi:hypothetical protein
MSSWSPGSTGLIRTKIVKQLNTVEPIHSGGYNSNLSVINNKLKHIVYTPPKCTDTAVILVFFNPTSSIRIQQNILYVTHQLKRARIPVFIGEVCFNDESPFFQESDTTFIFKSTSYMFYKENIINQVISKIPGETFTKFVILDADIVFEEPNWLDTVSAALDEYDILQPFNLAYKLNKSFIPDEIKIGVSKIEPTGHPGYAWAFRRDWFEKAGGLYEYALIGSGDTCLAYMIGAINTAHDVYKQDIPIIPSKMGHMRGNIYHLPHGTKIKRQHVSRILELEKIMKTNKIQKLADITEKNTDGILEWKQLYKNRMNSFILTYFKNRDDDDF